MPRQAMGYDKNSYSQISVSNTIFACWDDTKSEICPESCRALTAESVVASTLEYSREKIIVEATFEVAGL